MVTEKTTTDRPSAGELRKMIHVARLLYSEDRMEPVVSDLCDAVESLLEDRELLDRAEAQDTITLAARRALHVRTVFVICDSGEGEGDTLRAALQEAVGA